MATGLQDVRRGVQRLRESRGLDRAARLGLVGRGVFYLVLAYLCVRVALGVGGRQANANGALSAVASSGVGLALLVVAIVGFAAFAVTRLAGAYADRRTGPWRRLSTAGQALVYLALAAATTSFVLGQHKTGSEQQQRATTARVLELPGGRWIVAGVGVVVLAVCAWQFRVGLKCHYDDTLDTGRMGRALRALTKFVGSVGIIARAAAFIPVGIFLVVAAVTANPRESKGLDRLLLELTRQWWGRGVVLAVALGFLIFAVYTFLEARYREVQAGH